mgnify:CR=1 FL=1
MNRPKKTVVLGATGTLGAPICIHLKKAGYEVVAVGHRKSDNGFFADHGMPGTVLFSTFLGDFIEYEVVLDNGQSLIVNEYTKDTASVYEDGRKVFLSFDPNRVSLYAAETGEVLSK